jgi:hypothetical protein
MNGKRAKFLRHLARTVQAVNPEVTVETMYRQHTKRGNIIVDLKSVRSIYQRLKVRLHSTVFPRDVRTQHHRIREQAA